MHGAAVNYTDPQLDVRFSLYGTVSLSGFSFTDQAKMADCGLQSAG